MLEKEDALPSTENQTTFAHRDGFTGAGYRHPKMAGCVIRALQGMPMPWLTVGGHSVEKFLQILPSGPIGIFEDNQTGTGVADKDSNHPLTEAGFFEQFRHFIGDFVAATAGR